MENNGNGKTKKLQIKGLFRTNFEHIFNVHQNESDGAKGWEAATPYPFGNNYTRRLEIKISIKWLMENAKIYILFCSEKLSP